MYMQLGQIRTIIGSICVDDCHYCLLSRSALRNEDPRSANGGSGPTAFLLRINTTPK
jgi:hypothetical protein